MRGLGRCVVELAVAHAAARAHALHVARRDPDDIAQRVLVRQLALQHIADDLHVAVPMGAEAGPRRDAVLIDDAQVAPAHVGRVVVAGEREAVVGLQPAVVGEAASADLRKVNMVGSGLWHGTDFRVPGRSAKPADLMASFEFFE
jgi:hypothetical protein